MGNCCGKETKLPTDATDGEGELDGAETPPQRRQPQKEDAAAKRSSKIASKQSGRFEDEGTEKLKGGASYTNLDDYNLVRASLFPLSPLSFPLFHLNSLTLPLSFFLLQDSTPRPSAVEGRKSSSSSTPSRNQSIDTASSTGGRQSQELNERLANLERLMNDRMGTTERRTLVVSSIQTTAVEASADRQEEVSTPLEETASPVASPVMHPRKSSKPSISMLPDTPLHAKSRSNSSTMIIVGPRKSFRERSISQPFPKISSRRSSTSNFKSNTFPIFFENLLSMGVIAVQLVSDSKSSKFLKKRLYQVTME